MTARRHLAVDAGGQLPHQLSVARREAQGRGLTLVADHRHRQLPAVAGGADHVRGGNPRAVELDLAEFFGDTADHLQRALHDAGLVHRDDERRNPLYASERPCRCGPAPGTSRRSRVAGPDLVAVDDVVVAVAGRGRRQRGQVGAGAGLGEALAPALAAVDHAGQESLADLLAGVRAESHHQVAQAGPGRGARLGDLPRRRSRRTPAETLTAILFRPRRAEEAGGIQRPMPVPALAQ